MVDKSFRFRRGQSKETGYPIAYIFDHRRTEGSVGIEVEVEGNKFPKHDDNGNRHPIIPKEWDYHHDGSLRGKDNAEYVLRKPLSFEEVPQAVDNLWSMFNQYGSVLADSNRTSVHVHLNVQQFHLNRLTAFIALYVIVEELLTEWCGENRVGNLFCLRTKDAPYTLSLLKDFIISNGSVRFPQDFHYAGLNLHAISKFGSLEIRSLRGVQDADTLKLWVRVLQYMYDKSSEYNDPRNVIEGFSSTDPFDFFESIVGPEGHVLLEAIGWTSSQIRSSLLKGVRLAQDICYCREWSNYEPKAFTPHPFGVKKPRPTSAPSPQGFTIPPLSGNTVISQDVWNSLVNAEQEPQESDEF